MDKTFVVVNGEIVAADTASLHISDLAIQRGYGLFDFFKTIDGKPVFMEDHLDRFFESCYHMRLDPGCTKQQLTGLLFRLMAQNKMVTSGIKMVLTGGYSPDGYTPAKPNLVIIQQPLALNNEPSPVPLKIITYEHQRQLPHIKTIDYLVAIWLQPLIGQSHADDVLYHHNNLVTECPRANIFMVNSNEVLVTPATGMLKGVVRKQILQHFSAAMAIEEREITLNELMGAKEVFVTSSTKNIFPVGSIDGKLIGDGSIGPVTHRLRCGFFELLYPSKNQVQ